MIKTPDEIKLKYFDQVYKALISITNNADEDCPSEYRTDHFDSALDWAYHTISCVDEEVYNKDRADDLPPIKF